MTITTVVAFLGVLLAFTGAAAFILAFFRSSTIRDSNELLRRDVEDRTSRIEWLETEMRRQEEHCERLITELREQVAALSSSIVTSTVTASISALQKAILEAIQAARSDHHE